MFCSSTRHLRLSPEEWSDVVQTLLVSNLFSIEYYPLQFLHCNQLFLAHWQFQTTLVLIILLISHPKKVSSQYEGLYYLMPLTCLMLTFLRHFSEGNIGVFWKMSPPSNILVVNISLILILQIDRMYFYSAQYFQPVFIYDFYSTTKWIWKKS